MFKMLHERDCHVSKEKSLLERKQKISFLWLKIKGNNQIYKKETQINTISWTEINGNNNV